MSVDAALPTTVVSAPGAVSADSKTKTSSTKTSGIADNFQTFLTLLTNVLFGGRLTDMETAYKVFKREALDGIRLRCVGFDFEPEITAKLLKAGRRILEVPIGYQPRREDEGKKIRWIDGVDAIYTLIKCRLVR